MPNQYDIKDKQAIVTGGAKGIGRAIACKLRDCGARVWVWDLDAVAIDGVECSLVDITQPGQIAGALATRGAEPVIDLLVNDAGYLGRAQAFAGHAAPEWQRIVGVNLIGMMHVTQAVLPHMLHQRAGRIVNMASLAGKEGLASLAAYSAASAGVIAFTKALSREVAAQGVLVNCVAPGPIDTDMIRDLGTEAVQRMIADSPLQRLGTADEVAELVAWLSSGASSFNTGAVFDMSGGRARY